MRLSWNEVRARAAAFAEDWKDAAYQKGETQSFYNAFFHVFGVRRRNVARYEAHVAKLDNRSWFIDLFWPGMLIVEQKSAGRDLKAAYAQAGEYFDTLPERERPRYILVSDFQTFEFHDLDEREVAAFALADLPANVEAFGFILGVQRRTFRDQDPANIEAAELIGRLDDALAVAGHRGHDLERFLVRVVFCMFADDTGVFEPRDIFLDFIETRTGEDGADLGPWLAQLFDLTTGNFGLETASGEGRVYYCVSTVPFSEASLAPLSLKAGVVGPPSENPVSVRLFVAPLALVAAAVGPSEDPMSGPLVVAEIALVAAAVGIEKCPAAVPFAVPVITQVAVAGGPSVCSLSVQLPVAQVTFVALAVGPSEDPSSVRLAVAVLAPVVATVGIECFPSSVRLAVAVLAPVVATVGIECLPAAVPLTVAVLALVALAVGPFVDPVSTGFAAN